MFGLLVNVMFFDYGFNFVGNCGIIYNLLVGFVDDLLINVYKCFD